MLSATRRWFRRNRTSLAIGAGIVGAGYLATQYVVSKVTEARQRMSDERIAKEKYEVSSFLAAFTTRYTVAEYLAQPCNDPSHI
jgi:hypothetical protein